MDLAILFCSRALKFAKELGYKPEEFKARTGWIAKMLARSSKVNVNLQGEAQEMTDDKAHEAMVGFRTKLREIMESNGVPMDLVYNGDQTGLYFLKNTKSDVC